MVADVLSIVTIQWLFPAAGQWFMSKTWIESVKYGEYWKTNWQTQSNSRDHNKKWPSSDSSMMLSCMTDCEWRNIYQTWADSGHSLCVQNWLFPSLRYLAGQSVTHLPTSLDLNYDRHDKSGVITFILFPRKSAFHNYLVKYSASPRACLRKNKWFFLCWKFKLTFIVYEMRNTASDLQLREFFSSWSKRRNVLL